jgi:alkanesulfonate monooxygenase SsuD/methylene tetrahydromethanopterin reductase-like flavin-dependent oxidoreductase (luciferase family)
MRHIGLFLEELREGATDGAFFQELLETVDAAEAWGLDGIWLGEIHFLPSRSILSSPLVVAAALAARTRRLCIGTAVHVIPLRNPLGVAEDVATLDHLSGGRFEFGIGRSGSPRSYNLLGIPYEESQGRLMESLELMREAWKGERFSFHGKYYDVENAIVGPRPLQKPHPPVRIAALNPASFVRAAELGLHIFVGLRGTDISILRGHIDHYEATWRSAGHPGEGSVYLRIPLYAAPTDEQAVAESKESVVYYFRRQAELARTGTGSGTTTTGERLAQADELATLSLEHILRERVVIGSPASLTDRLRELREQLHLDGIIVEPNPGGRIPVDGMMRSLELLAKEVAPALRGRRR